MTVPPLNGIRVLELGHAIAAPHCAQILGDQGAQVIRIEPPGGDRTRGALPVVDGDSVYFAAHNRGKRSIIVDLKEPRGQAAFLTSARQRRRPSGPSLLPPETGCLRHTASRSGG